MELSDYGLYLVDIVSLYSYVSIFVVSLRAHIVCLSELAYLAVVPVEIGDEVE